MPKYCNNDFDEARPCYSQPAPAANSYPSVSIPPNESEIYSFSQPTQVEDLLLSSQLLSSQPVSTVTNVIITYIFFHNLYIMVY